MLKESLVTVRYKSLELILGNSAVITTSLFVSAISTRGCVIPDVEKGALPQLMGELKGEKLVECENELGENELGENELGENELGEKLAECDIGENELGEKLAECDIGENELE